MTRIVSPTHLVINNTNYYLRPHKILPDIFEVYKEEEFFYVTMYNDWNEYLEKIDVTLPHKFKAAKIAYAYHSYLNPERLL